MSLDVTMTLPFLDITRPGFSTKSDEVLKARETSWCAETPFGFAVLRHRQAGMLLRDRRLREPSMGFLGWCQKFPREVGKKGDRSQFA